MSILRRRVHPAAWLAAAAVLLLALLPTLGHAWSAGQAGWALVCGAQGPRWVPLGDDGAPAPSAQVQGDCAACLWTAAAPPVQPSPRWSPPSDAAGVVPAPATVPARQAAWQLAAPRAPPAG